MSVRTQQPIPTYNKVPAYLLLAVILSAPAGWLLFWLVSA